MLRLTSVVSLLSLVACSAAVDVAPGPAPRPESDEPTTLLVSLRAVDGSSKHLGLARAALDLGDGRAAVVDDNDTLSLRDGASRLHLLDHVVEAPVLLDDGRLIAARQTSPGETDLWIVTLDGAPPRALAAAPGADGQPFVLNDGRVLFTSDRDGVVGLYVAGLDDDVPTQLTNRGEVPGALSDSFVPVPVRVLAQRGGEVHFDAGDGELWSVHLRTGRGGPLAPNGDILVGEVTP